MLIRSVSHIEAKYNFIIRFSLDSEKIFREATLSLLKKISPQFREEELEYAVTGKIYWMRWNPADNKKYECRICSNKIVELSATAISLFASYSIATSLAKGKTEFKRGFANYAAEILDCINMLPEATLLHSFGSEPEQTEIYAPIVWTGDYYENMRKHTKMRFFERFGKRYDDIDLRRICKRIELNYANFVCDGADGRKIFHIAYDNISFLCVYNARMNCIHTVLRPEWYVNIVSTAIIYEIVKKVHMSRGCYLMSAMYA